MAGGIGSITRWVGDVINSQTVTEAGRIASNFWGQAATQGWAKPDPTIFSNTFLKNPSLKRAVGIISEAVPSLFTALTVGIGFGAPAAAGALGLLEGAPQYEEAFQQGGVCSDRRGRC